MNRMFKTNLLAVAACLLTAGCLFAGTTVCASKIDRPVLRVGCNDTQQYMFHVGEDKRKSGYGYEYLQQLSYYGGWEYEYVYASFPKQLEMLKQGEIDLMVNVSYTEERAKTMNYSAAPMGEEIYCLCVKPGSNLSISDLSTFSGKKVGAIKNSYQLQLLRDWVAENQVDCIIYETESVEDEAELDALVTMNMYSIGEWTPLLELGSSQYYFGLSQHVPGLAEQFNAAHRALLEVQPYFNQELQTKYFGQTLLNRELSPEEQRWIKEHPVIRLGYYSHYDAEHNGLDGLVTLLDDIVQHMQPHLDEYGIELKCVEFSSAQEMEKALLAGEIQLTFPAYGNLWLADQHGHILSSKLYSPTMLAFSKDTAAFETMFDTIAVVKEDPIQYPYISENYPDAELKYYASVLDCMKAVKHGEVGCTIINSQVAEGLLQSNSGLRGLNFFVDLSDIPPEITFGVTPGEPELLSLINKEIHLLPPDLYESSINEYYISQNETVIKEYAEKILFVIFLILTPLSVLVWLYIRRIRTQAETLKRSNEAIIDMLGMVVEYRSKESGAHIWRVKQLTKVLGEYFLTHFPEYNLTERSLDVIVASSALHDIGKVAIPDSILLKPGKLTDAEFEEMKKHTTLGAQLLASIEENWNSEYESVSYDICRYHHERHDGGGYPDGLVGDEIPISAQIVSIVDVYDAMTHARCYKPSFSSEEVIQMIENGDCGAFSPKLLEALWATREKLEEVVKNNPDVLSMTQSE